METVAPLTQKAINSIANTGYLNVWEGAVRSGKTIASSLAWISYVYNSKEKFFIMSGKTIAALYRNVISGAFGMLAMLGDGGVYRTDREGNRLLVINHPEGKKICYCFGANDERSYGVLRGITAGGWYADEVNLQPRSFVEEAFRRTIVSSDRRHFWTLNPDNPKHWIYVDFIDKYEEQGLKGFYLWKFALSDNKSLPPERAAELKAQYHGIFYKKYIEGQRTMGEGAIYPMFGEANLYDDEERPHPIEYKTIRYISGDYGTANPLHLLDIRDDGDIIWVDNEYRWDSRGEIAMRTGIGQKTNSQYCKDMREFMNLGPDCEVIMDPSAASYIEELSQAGFYVSKGNNDVLNGIQVVSSLLGNRKIRISRTRCPILISELTGYSWDEKSVMKGKEAPLKINDHGPDALRYFCFTSLPSWRTGFDKSKSA